jgi:hypothetical protein
MTTGKQATEEQNNVTKQLTVQCAGEHSVGN